MKKWNIEKLKSAIEDMGYTLHAENFKNIKQYITVEDSEGYYYYTTYYSLLKSTKPWKYSKFNIYSIQNIKLWCRLNDKNFQLISKKYNRNNTHLTWKCSREGCGEIFNSSWLNISNHYGCPFCANQKVNLSNCLATRKPELIGEWHSIKNNLTPYDVLAGTPKKVWWICEKKHEWEASVSSRYTNGSGCPYCAGYYPTKEDNLFTKNPELCKLWDYQKNKKHPSEFGKSSCKKVWWKCDDCNHGWESTINARSHHDGCPNCSISKGEKRVEKFLKNRSINFKQQKTFCSLRGIGNGLLSYDFYLPEHNLLIEYQGEFHDRKIYEDHDFERQKEHDRRKREYAKNNNIKLLEIWYWDFENVEEILNKELGFTGYDQTRST